MTEALALEMTEAGSAAEMTNQVPAMPDTHPIMARSVATRQSGGFMHLDCFTPFAMTGMESGVATTKGGNVGARTASFVMTKAGNGLPKKQKYQPSAISR
jgi:hypothetical protein